MSRRLTVQTRQGRISTEVEVLGDGPPLVYLHGTFGFSTRTSSTEAPSRLRRQ